MSEKLPLFGNRYQLEEKKGTGGMAIVYRATDLKTGHQVAIKVLQPEYQQDEEFVDRFEREAIAARRMNHHNIVNLLDVDSENGQRYLVMEYVDGTTLKDIIHERGALSAQTAVQVAVRILAALQHAHDNGIIHRDIKPQNILINTEGHVKVSDFGIARVAGHGTASRDDTVMGSVYYFSPEQARGKTVSAASDLYSVGVTLYEMLTGRVPFTGDTPVSVAMQHIMTDPVPVNEVNPDISPALSAVVMHAMEKDPAQRYQQAREMAIDLQAALSGGVLQYTPMPETQPKQTKEKSSKRKEIVLWIRKHQRTLYYAMTAVVTVGVLVGLYMGLTSIYSGIVTTVNVPAVEGYEETAAVRILEKAGLQYQTVTIHHATVPKGVVISQTPEYDSSLKKGETVVLSVSEGPKVFLTPSVLGQQYEDAKQMLLGSDLMITAVERVVSEEPSGVIVRQQPEADEPCAAGDTIQVSVSGGSVIVPEITGMSCEEANAALKEAGLNISATIEYRTTDVIENNGIVVDTVPDIGANVIEGTLVTLVVETYQLSYTADVVVSVPASSEAISVRVTLINLSDEEEEQLLTTVPADADRNLNVKLTTGTPGRMNYRVYFNNVLSYTGTAELQ